MIDLLFESTVLGGRTNEEKYDGEKLTHCYINLKYTIKSCNKSYLFSDLI